jgi:hypothetical protein
MSYNLFLDDLRMPKDAYIYPRRGEDKIILVTRSLQRVSGIDNINWDIVRNYNDFVSIIEKRGLPDAVSFDHDLHEEHIEHYYKVTKEIGIIEYANFRHKTGKHCAEYFVQQCKELNPIQPPKVFIHSANQCGVQEIKNILTNSGLSFYD